MRNLFAFLSIALVVAFGGCIFSPDDNATPKPPAQGWQPEMWVTPDSVSVFFPNDWPDTTTFTWNVWGKDTREFVMDAVVRISSSDFHIAFERSSDGGTPQRGTFAELAAGAVGWFWSTDPATGEILGRKWPFNEVHVLPNGVLVRLDRGVDGFVYAAPSHPGTWPVKFQRRFRLDVKRAAGRVEYRHDTAQLRARDVKGPLGPEDYVVMDVVLRSDYRWMTPVTAVVSSTDVLPFYYEPYFGGDLIERDMASLQPENDTHAAFSVVRLRKLDTSALSQIGYKIGEVDHPPPPDAIYLSVSAIGYNHAENQALVYGSYYCGNLCAAGTLYLLEKVEGFWVIKKQVELWIS